MLAGRGRCEAAASLMLCNKGNDFQAAEKLVALKEHDFSRCRNLRQNKALALAAEGTFLGRFSPWYLAFLRHPHSHLTARPTARPSGRRRAPDSENGSSTCDPSPVWIGAVPSERPPSARAAIPDGAPVETHCSDCCAVDTAAESAVAASAFPDTAAPAGTEACSGSDSPGSAAGSSEAADSPGDHYEAASCTTDFLRLCC